MTYTNKILNILAFAVVAFLVIALSFTAANNALAYMTYDLGGYDYGYNTYDLGSSYSSYNTYDLGGSYNYNTYDLGYDYGSYNYNTYDLGYDYGSYNYNTYDLGYYDTTCYFCDDSYSSPVVSYDYGLGYDYGYDYGVSYGGYNGISYQNVSSFNYSDNDVNNNVNNSTNITYNNTSSNNDNLRVVCRVSDTTIEEGDRVTFEADVYGGDSPYDYDWNGAISGDDKEITAKFNNEGKYYVSVTVTDDNGNTDTDDCNTINVDNDNNNDDFEVICRVSDTTIEEGDRVTFEADVSGGNSPFDYDWRGDTEGEDENDDTIRVRYGDEGDYDVRVVVTDDDGQRASDDCRTVRVDNDNDNNNDVNVITNLGTPNGTQASLNSVFLSQVPYTGADDWLKVGGFIGLLIVWSAIVVTYYRKTKASKSISKKVSDFKKLNKVNQIA